MEIGIRISTEYHLDYSVGNEDWNISVNSIFGILCKLAKNPSDIFDELGRNVHTASNYFFNHNYMILQALNVNYGVLSQIGFLLAYTVHQKFDRQLTYRVCSGVLSLHESNITSNVRTASFFYQITLYTQPQPSMRHQQSGDSGSLPLTQACVLHISSPY